MRLIPIVVVLAMLALPMSVLAQDRQIAPQIVSIVQLLSSPERYDGQHIAVLGFLTIGMENNNLYLAKNDYDNALLPNSIRVHISDEMVKKSEELNMKYVRIAGVFHVGHLGRNGSSVGEIAEIFDCSVISDPNHPFSEKLKGLVRHNSDPN
jgi:hypothetical protein